MTTFRQVVESKGRIPQRFVTLKRSDFVDTWPAKPQEELVLGLRKISDGDIQTARAEAAKFAIQMHDDRVGQIEAYNDALMRWLIVSGTCDAGDTGLMAPIFEGSEENVRFALTAGAIRYVWDNIDAFHVEMNPIVPTIDDEEVVDLVSRLLEGFPEGLSKTSEVRIRKFLGMVLRELQELDEEKSDLRVKPV